MEERHLKRGPVLTPQGVRFSLYSPHADEVEVCLFDSPSDGIESRRVALEPAEGGNWQGIATDSTVGQLYGFRVHGPFAPSTGHRFNSRKLLVDPCALAVTGEPPLDDAFSGSCPGDDLTPDQRDTGSIAPKSIVVDREFDWQGDVAPATPWKKSVIYECHVRGMSIQHPDVPEPLRGTYLGLASEPILDHLVSLGVTAIELLPVQQIASEPHLLRNGRTNYFGYSPLGFIAPHSGYAINPLGGQVDEFKSMVKAFHQRGIEVILDLIFNHTAEGDHVGRTLSLRGIDNRTYYRLHPADQRRYDDVTGCGNTIAADRPAVAALLLDCLRYWVDEMHVDGFRFDLAVTLGRQARGFSARAPFFDLVAVDPVLAGTKLIAEPWDLGPGGYQLGRFPSGWSEWNDQFRDGARAAWRGNEISAYDIARIVDGSQAIFGSAGRGADASIHFVTCHDGFTLEDLVSYETKNNWDNGENNDDGHSHNLSRNWGMEGPTSSPRILEHRRRAKRNLLTMLLLSSGVPMLSHGDELGRTQRGNNNAYCQNGPLTWIDWTADARDNDLLDFTRRIVELRSQIDPVRESTRNAGTPGDERQWLTPFGQPLSPSSRQPSSVAGLLLDRPDHSYFLVFNPSSRNRVFQLPRQAASGHWARVLSTAHPGGRRISGATYRSAALSISVLRFDSSTPGESGDSLKNPGDS